MFGTDRCVAPSSRLCEINFIEVFEHVPSGGRAFAGLSALLATGTSRAANDRTMADGAPRPVTALDSMLGALSRYAMRATGKLRHHGMVAARLTAVLLKRKGPGQRCCRTRFIVVGSGAENRADAHALTCAAMYLFISNIVHLSRPKTFFNFSSARISRLFSGFWRL